MERGEGTQVGAKRQNHSRWLQKRQGQEGQAGMMTLGWRGRPLPYGHS